MRSVEQDAELLLRMSLELARSLTFRRLQMRSAIWSKVEMSPPSSSD